MQVGNPKLIYTGQRFAPKSRQKSRPGSTDSGEGWLFLCMLHVINSPLYPTGCRAKPYQSQAVSSKLCWSITETIKCSDVLEFLSILQLFLCSLNQLLRPSPPNHFSSLSEKAGKWAILEVSPSWRTPSVEEASEPGSFYPFPLL